MKKHLIFLLIVLNLLAVSCQPSQGAIQTAIAQTESVQYTIQTAIAQTQTASANALSSISTPLPTITPTEGGSAACQPQTSDVVDYFTFKGYRDFIQEDLGGGNSLLTLDELDSRGYGKLIGIHFSGNCVTEIRAIYSSHDPQSQSESDGFSPFMTVVSTAGLTHQQNLDEIQWLQSSKVKDLPRQAYETGKATQSLQLSSPNKIPFIELTFEIYKDMRLTKYLVVFNDSIALDSATPYSGQGTNDIPCYSWDKVTKSFAGRTICVFGSVQIKYNGSAYSHDGSYNYRYVFKFSNKPNTFYIVDVNLSRFDLKTIYLAEYPNLHIGDCISSEGIIELDSNQAPFMRLGQGLNACP